jgi:hypothetical protein
MQVRTRLGALLACVVVGCSVTPELSTPACHHESRDCSPDAVQSRVLESFSSVKVKEVLACVDAPALFCSSGSADEEACLISMDSKGTAEYRTSDAHDSGTPPIVLTLFRTFGVNHVPDRPMHRQFPGPHGEPRNEAIFSSSEGRLAVLYISEVRCIDISEIT